MDLGVAHCGQSRRELRNLALQTVELARFPGILDLAVAETRLQVLDAGITLRDHLLKLSDLLTGRPELRNQRVRLLPRFPRSRARFGDVIS